MSLLFRCLIRRGDPVRLPATTLLVCVGLLGIPAVKGATLDFEGILDLTPLSNQYSGVTFSNATVITSGLSLNEFEFPPFSGTSVIFDDGGLIGLSFLSPVSTFSGYFTYNSALTLTFYGPGATLLGTVNSAFANNTALSGDVGSAPNELLSFSNLTGIATIEILGDPFGASFVGDDFTTTEISSGVPEPSLFALTAACLAGLYLRRRLK